MTSRPSRPSRHCAVEFQALPARITQVRRIIAAQLRYWHLEPLTDPVLLGVTELLANVHRHAGPDKRCAVEIVFVHDRLTVSVRDHDPNLPRRRASGALATSGRGLALVAAVSESWGMQARQDGCGKVVWFTLPAPSAAPRHRAAAARMEVSPGPEGSGGAPAPSAQEAPAAAPAVAELRDGGERAAAPTGLRPRASFA